MRELGFFQFFRERSLENLQILGLILLNKKRLQKDSDGVYSIYLSFFFLLDGMFITIVYSSRRGRFVNSTFPNMKIFAQKY